MLSKNLDGVIEKAAVRLGTGGGSLSQTQHLVSLIYLHNISRGQGSV